MTTKPGHEMEYFDRVTGNDLLVNSGRVRLRVQQAANALEQALVALSVLEHDQQEREHESAHQEEDDTGSERGIVSASG